MSAVRTLLVDDNRDFLAALVDFLGREPRVRVIGWQASGTALVEIVDAARPDLVLLDVSLPGRGGIELAREIKSRAGAPRVILLTLHDEPEYRRAAAEARADAFVAKRRLASELLPLIRRLFAEEPAGREAE